MSDEKPEANRRTTYVDDATNKRIAALQAAMGNASEAAVLRMLLAEALAYRDAASPSSR